MKTYTINLNEGVFINNILINEKIFREELTDWVIVKREEQINNLINWISECRRESDKALMKEDLKYLIGLKDEFIFSSIFSSILTNEYISKSDNLKEFKDICDEILKLNEELDE